MKRAGIAAAFQTRCHSFHTFFLIGLSAILRKIKIIGPSFRVWDIAFYRFCFGIVILYGIYGGRESLIKGSNPRLLILRGILGSVMALQISRASASKCQD